MAKRRGSYAQVVRDRIAVGQLIERLFKHAMGEIEMSQTQVNAAKVLIGKCVPDLKAIEQKTTGEIINYVVNAAPELTPSEWQKKHGQSGDHSQAHKPH